MQRKRGRPPSVWECSYVSDPAPHRRRRLLEERKRVETRLAWAERRGNRAKVEHLEAVLLELDEALALPEEQLDGTGRATEIRRRYGDETARSLGW